MEKLAQQGYIVLAVDLRGMGETERGDNPRIRWTIGLFGPDYHEFMLAYLLGKSYVGMRAEDVLVSARFLAGYQTEGSERRVRLIGIGEAGIPALHAAALEPDLFEAIRLRNTLRSWTDVVRSPEARNQLTGTVHGALKVCDLPDLVNLCGPGKLTVEEPFGP